MTDAEEAAPVVAESKEIIELDRCDDEKATIKLMDEYETAFMRTEMAEKAGLVYAFPVKRNGQWVTEYRLGYMGIKQAVHEQANRGNIISIEEDPHVELVKYDRDDQETWHWQAAAAAKSLTTQMRTIGLAEHPFLETGKDGIASYDPFGRTTAVSKALRNAYRMQVPEPAIQMLLQDIAKRTGRDIVFADARAKLAASEDAKSEAQSKPSPNKKPTATKTTATKTTQAAKKSNTNPKSNQSDNEGDDEVGPYMDALKRLGYDGPRPATRKEAAQIITALSEGKPAPAPKKEAKAKPAPKPKPKPQPEPSEEKKDWHDDPITDKQKYALQKHFGISDEAMPQTKGEAHKLMNELKGEDE